MVVIIFDKVLKNRIGLVNTMPINATIGYQKAERKYHEARTIAEKIRALEEMLREAPGHKGAENLRNEIKQKLSKIRELQEKQKTAGSRQTIAVKKEGAAQVVIIGVANSGKSTLLSKLTNAKPEISPHPFTTKLPEIGIMDYQGVKVQLVEIPAITEGFSSNDLGPTLLGIVRQAELIIILSNEDSELELIKNELANSNVVTDKPKPKIVITKASSGGLMFVGKIKANIDEVKTLLRTHGVHNGTVEFQQESTFEDLEEVLTEGIAYVKAIVVNKNDNPGILREKIWKNLGLIKVYTKQPGKKKDYPPIAMKEGSTIKDLALRIHKDFLAKFKFARVWGESVKFQGAQSGLSLVLHDEDVVEFHIR